MKCRFSHVTNSSSSSFIIAKHESCTREDIHTALNNMRDDIKRFLESNGKWLRFRDESIKELLKTGDIDIATVLAINELEDELYDFYTPLVLDYWECGSEEFSDEDGEFFAVFLMNFGDRFKCNALKIR